MKVPTTRDPYPLVGVCNAVSARGRHCVLAAGHDVSRPGRPAQPVHRNARGSPFLEVLDLTWELKRRLKR